MKTLSDILKELEQGKISADRAEVNIFDLFTQKPVPNDECPNCKNKLILMSGSATLEPDEEEKPTDIDIIDKFITVYFCENCNEIISIIKN